MVELSQAEPEKKIVRAKKGHRIKFKDFSFIGFDETEMEQIHKAYHSDDEVELDLIQKIADITNCYVGFTALPMNNPPFQIIRLRKEG